MKPASLLRAVVGGFTVDEFVMDDGERTGTCPASHTVAFRRTRKAVFAAFCRGFALQSRRTTGVEGPNRHEEVVQPRPCSTDPLPPSTQA
jgi:hypothetical protein